MTHKDSLPWIISVDDHVIEPPHLWETWLPARLRDRGPRIVQNTCETILQKGQGGARWIFGGNGPIADWWTYEDIPRPIPQVMASAASPPEDLTMAPIPFSEMREGFYEPKSRLVDMNMNRTERSLCFPTICRFAGQMFLEAKDKTLALACVQAYNDWMIDEWCGASGGRLIPLCLIPLWDPALAAVEIRRNAARGCKAITFTELPSNLGLPSIHDRDRFWDPMLAASDETGTVINMHIGSGSKLATTSDDAPLGVGNSLTSLNAYMAMADWLLSGALIRFPNLKLAFSESQVGWIPFLLERLDRVFTRSQAWSDFDPSLTDLPSTQVPGRVFGCFFDDMVGVDLRHQIGIKQLVFETDYPHQDSDWPNTHALIAQIAERVDPGEIEMLVRTNAIEMLGLDPTDLKPRDAGDAQ